MYRRRNNGQISIAEFHLPFGGTLDPSNRWVKLEELMPWLTDTSARLVATERVSAHWVGREP